jgi:hypothetical protein
MNILELPLHKEDDAWMLSSRNLYHLTDADEYYGIVHNYYISEISTRLLADIVEFGTDRHWWVDTTTGSLYNAETGKGFGPRILQLPPMLTGRKVPDTDIRKHEAEVRYLNSQIEEQCNVSEYY